MIRNVNDGDGRDRYLPLSLGQVVVTATAMEVFEQHPMPVEVLVNAMLIMHSRGDWGVVDPEDAKANDHAIKHGERVLSAYDLPITGTRVWVITEWDRSATTILLPSDY